MVGLTTFLPMYAVALVLLTKISLLKNIISKNELIQTVKIYKSRDVSETIPVCASATLRCAYRFPRFSGLICTILSYTNQWFFAEVYNHEEQQHLER